MEEANYNCQMRAKNGKDIWLDFAHLEREAASEKLPWYCFLCFCCHEKSHTEVVERNGE